LFSIFLWGPPPPGLGGGGVPPNHPPQKTPFWGVGTPPPLTQFPFFFFWWCLAPWGLCSFWFFKITLFGTPPHPVPPLFWGGHLQGDFWRVRGGNPPQKRHGVFFLGLVVWEQGGPVCPFFQPPPGTVGWGKRQYNKSPTRLFFFSFFTLGCFLFFFWGGGEGINLGFPFWPRMCSFFCQTQTLGKTFLGEGTPPQR